MKLTSTRISELRVTPMELIQAIQHEWPHDVLIQSIPLDAATVEVSTTYNHNRGGSGPDVVIRWGGRDYAREEAKLPEDRPGEPA